MFRQKSLRAGCVLASILVTALVVGCGDDTPPIGATADATATDAAPGDAAVTDGAIADAATDDAHNSGAPDAHAGSPDAHAGSPDAHDSGSPDAHAGAPDAHAGSPDAHAASPDATTGTVVLTPTSTVNSPLDFGSAPNDGSSSNSLTITLTNNTSTTLFNLGQDFTHGTTSSMYTLTGTGCGATLTAGRFCQIFIKFGPASANDFIGVNAGTLVVTYTLGEGGPHEELDYPMTGTVTNTLTQIGTVSGMVTRTTGIQSGTGATHGNPFHINQGDGATVTITYAVTNTGGQADIFNIDGPIGSLGVTASPWTVTANTCKLLTLTFGDNSCFVTFTNASTINIDTEDDIDIADNFVMTWNDAGGSEMSSVAPDTIFVVVDPAPL